MIDYIQEAGFWRAHAALLIFKHAYRIYSYLRLCHNGIIST